MRFLLQPTPFLVMGLMMVVVLVAAVAVVANKSIIGLRAAYRVGASDAVCLQWRRIVQHKCCPRAGTALPEHVLEAHTRGLDSHTAPKSSSSQVVFLTGYNCVKEVCACSIPRHSC